MACRVFLAIVSRAVASTQNPLPERPGSDEQLALGSDFDGEVVTPFEVAFRSELTDAFLKDGSREEKIRAVMGENALRFFGGNHSKWKERLDARAKMSKACRKEWLCSDRKAGAK